MELGLRHRKEIECSVSRLGADVIADTTDAVR